jgi:feruloyl esterase
VQPGGEPDYILNLLFGIPAGFDQDWARYFLNKPNWSFRDWNTSKEEVYKQSVTLDPGLGTANKTSLPTFRSRGKMVLYHGIADGLIPVGSSTGYYEAARQNNPQADLNNWFQYYQIPGMHHCAYIPSAQDNSRPPWYIAAAMQLKFIEWRKYNGFSVPNHEFDPEYDVFQALINWVERGTGFDHLVATSWGSNVDTSSPRTRKICPYPQKAVFKGGNPDVHTNWQSQNV